MVKGPTCEGNGVVTELGVVPASAPFSAFQPEVTGVMRWPSATLAEHQQHRSCSNAAQGEPLRDGNVFVIRYVQLQWTYFQRCALLCVAELTVGQTQGPRHDQQNTGNGGDSHDSSPESVADSMPYFASLGIRRWQDCANKNACTRQANRLANCLVPKVGLEPTLCHHNRILSPARLPFRHFGIERRQF